MGYYLAKLLISAILIVVISEVAKRSSLLGGLIASLPIVSLLAFVWLYIDTRSLEKVAALSSSIFWLVLPSLSLLIVLPILLRKTENFAMSLSLALLTMLLCYALTLFLLRKYDIQWPS